MNRELFYEIATNHIHAVIMPDNVKKRLSDLECDPTSLALVDIDDEYSNPKKIISDIHDEFQSIPIIGTTKDASKIKNLKKTLDEYNITHIVFEPTIKSLEVAVENFMAKAINNKNNKTIFLDDHLKNRIRRDLIGLGCKAASNGIPLIVDAILFLIKRGNSEFSITKDVYFYLAKKHNTTTAAVERNIRYCLGQIKDKHNVNLIEKVFPCVDIEYLTNSEFISILTEYYRGEDNNDK